MNFVKLILSNSLAPGSPHRPPKALAMHFLCSLTLFLAYLRFALPMTAFKVFNLFICSSSLVLFRPWSSQTFHMCTWESPSRCFCFCFCFLQSTSQGIKNADTLLLSAPASSGRKHIDHRKDSQTCVSLVSHLPRSLGSISVLVTFWM